MRRLLAPLALLSLLAGAGPAAAGEPPVYRLEIQAQAFAPAALQIPAGQRVKLLVTNSRKLPSEFESFELNREKVVPPGATVTIWIGPLKPGRYKIFDDFNPATTGWIVASDSAPPPQP